MNDEDVCHILITVRDKIEKDITESKFSFVSKPAQERLKHKVELRDDLDYIIGLMECRK